ncbi:MAG TPA: DUF1553 domain-containing protein, partial [Planctomycetaceae bacterium]|nr:DUF1553 domain-containing protein [Planctomycetaceae bacterium]
MDVATGFLVGGPWDQVKSVDPGLTLQQRADELHDMISTTGSAFLGLTVGCARCHNHKFDPISQQDYYALKAALSGVQHGERPVSPADSAIRKQRAAELRLKLVQLERELSQFEPRAFDGRTIFLDDDSPDPSSEGPRVQQIVSRTGLQPHRAGTGRGQSQDPGDVDHVPNLGRGYSHWNQVAGKNVFAWQPGVAGTFRVWISWGCGYPTHAPDARYLLDADGDLDTTADQTELARVDQRTFADGSGGIAQSPLWSGLLDVGARQLNASSRIILRAGETEAVVTADVLVFQEVPTKPAANETSSVPALRTAVRSNAANIDRFPPVEAQFMRFTVLQTSTPSEPCLDELECWTAESEPRNVSLAEQGAKVSASGNFADASLHQLAKVHDGNYGNGSSWISNEVGKGWVQLEFRQRETIDRVVWSRDRDGVEPHFTDRTPTAFRIDVSLDGQNWRTVATSTDRIPLGWNSAPVQALPMLKLGERQRYAELRHEQAVLQAEISKLTAEPMLYAGRLGTPEPVHRLHRGDPQELREPVLPAGLSEFGSPWQLPAEATDQERRRAVAQWIVDPSQPLTARVIVNRLWQQHFGQGIVTTPSDFGRNGARPSHPELLDWLSLSLVEREWSLKAVHRQIVQSHGYRQSSASTPVGLSADAANRLLWRFSPRRLEAEPLRDALLSVSGNLDDRMGGPGFDLFEPNANYVKVYASKKS